MIAEGRQYIRTRRGGVIFQKNIFFLNVVFFAFLVTMSVSQRKK